MPHAFSRPIQCLFYSHVWAIHLLRQAQRIDLSDAVLVELAVESNLAALVKDEQPRRYGVAGLLAFRNCLDKLATRYKNIAAPLVLASQPPVPVAALESAVSLLPVTESGYKKAVLLVHISDARRFDNLYPYIDQFGILWDIADLPNAPLEQLAQRLLDTDSLSGGRWCGFNLVCHPLRQTGDSAQRQALLQSIIDQFPGL